jgi:hypothetical protein
VEWGNHNKKGGELLVSPPVRPSQSANTASLTGSTFTALILNSAILA